jgi:hypothetical protein
MRVTKIIREYVEKTIKEKMPYGEPTTAYKQHCQSLSDLTSQLNERINAYAEELLASVGNLPEGFTIKKTQWSIFESSTWNSPMHTAAAAHERQVRENREKAIENILVELELGATKADLERLIAEAINM